MNLLDLLKQYLPQLLSFLFGFLQREEMTKKIQDAIESQKTKEAIASGEKTLELTRLEFREDGIFSQLSLDGKILAFTLEHSYDLKPKLYNGTFECVRGPHRLHGMTEDFETFEVEGVQGHSGILFHWGNYNKDSDGCILIGKEIVETNGIKMITNSKETFAEFTKTLEGVNKFKLIVK